MMYEAFDSPGCTLEHMIIFFLNLFKGKESGFCKNSKGSISSKFYLFTQLVMINIGNSRPLRDLQRIVSLTKC